MIQGVCCETMASNLIVNVVHCQRTNTALPTMADRQNRFSYSKSLIIKSIGCNNE